jgi:hypothetical protein
MIYIQRRDAFGLETVDQFATSKEARAMLAEYRMSDPSAHYYTSSRPCKNWRVADQQECSGKTVKLLVDKHYPAAWVFNFAPLRAGTVVPVVPASNLPDSQGKYWVNTPELKDDAYGVLLVPGEYTDSEAA